MKWARRDPQPSREKMIPWPKREQGLHNPMTPPTILPRKVSKNLLHLPVKYGVAAVVKTMKEAENPRVGNGVRERTETQAAREMGLEVQKGTIIYPREGERLRMETRRYSSMRDDNVVWRIDRELHFFVL